MIKRLIDSTGKEIYVGDNAEQVRKVLVAPADEVTEEDEVNYEDILRTAKWTGELKYQILVKLKFKGIDDFNRPVFKDIDGKAHFGSVDILFPNEKIAPNDSSTEIAKYFQDHPEQIEYFGTSFNCEPHGGLASHVKLEFIGANEIVKQK